MDNLDFVHVIMEDDCIGDNESGEYVEEGEEQVPVKRGVERCKTCDDYVPLEDLKFNDDFCCDFYARKAIADFCDKFHHPFQIKATQRDNAEKGILGKTVYKCTHGVDRSKGRGPAQVRCVQYHNYTGCTAQISIRKQRTGRWAVRTCICINYALFIRISQFLSKL